MGMYPPEQLLSLGMKSGPKSLFGGFDAGIPGGCFHLLGSQRVVAIISAASRHHQAGFELSINTRARRSESWRAAGDPGGELEHPT